MSEQSIPIIDLKRQYASVKEEVDSAIRRVVEGGRYMMGAEVEAFEEEFAAYCGTAHAVAVGSGTAALNLSLRVQPT